jgi:hypothetical protein
MTRRFAAAAAGLAAAGLAFTAALSAQTPLDRRHWQYAAPIDVAQASEPRLVSVLVPPAITARAREQWADLRVVDGAGREVPYVLHASPARPAAEWRPVRLLEPSTVAGQFTQVVLDTGLAARVHNAVRLTIVRDRDFLTWVEVAVADDGRTWRIVRERGPIFDLSSEGLGSATTVEYPDSLSRYVRLKILDGSRAYALQSAEVADDEPVAGDLQPAGVSFVPATESTPHRTVWMSAADAPRVPVAAIRFETTQESFARPVGIEISDDERTWRRLASGEILRLRDAGGELRESLSIAVPETSAGRWRVTVYDRDDAAVRDLRPVAYATPRRVVFRQQPGATYQLIFGHTRADAPEYDMRRLHDAAALAAATPVTLGAEIVNPDYADPAPWSERHPAVLWGALVAAVLVLGGVTIRALRSSV